eukprot:scaffold115858_cov24-Phaeocystis_antarctica.AAC.1
MALPRLDCSPARGSYWRGLSTDCWQQAAAPLLLLGWIGANPPLYLATPHVADLPLWGLLMMVPLGGGIDQGIVPIPRCGHSRSLGVSTLNRSPVWAHPNDL